MGEETLGRPGQQLLTRRAVLGGALRAGGALTLLAGGGLLAACGGDDEQRAAPDTAATGQATTGAAAGTPKRGGTLVFGASSAPSGFDPAKWWNGLSWSGTAAVFDRLVRLTSEGTVEPELLDALPEVNSDGTLYRFRLRDGVRFHHGRSLTADDVKFSIERLVSPATGSEGASLYTALTIPGMADVQSEKAAELPGIQVLDDRSFTIELENPDSSFLFVMGLPFAGIVPRDVVEDVGDKKFNFAPVGSGPFVMKDVDPSRRLVLERFSDYWDGERPYVDRVEWEIGVEPELQVLRIQNGEQDLSAEDIPSATLDGLRNNPEFEDQLFVDLSNNVFYITLSLKHEALKDLRVRQAIAHAVDKERLVRTLKGLGEPATGGLFSPLSPYFQDGLSYPFDRERAKELLGEAGFGGGFDVTFWGTNFTPWIEIIQTTQQDLAEIGIRVEAKAQPLEAWLSKVVENPPGITENQWELPYPHGSYVMDGAFTSSALDAGCCNFSNYVSGEFDDLARRAHASTDADEIVELYKEMDRIAVKDEALWVPLFYPKRAQFVSKRLGGYQLPVTPTADMRFFADYWIEES